MRSVKSGCHGGQVIGPQLSIHLAGALVTEAMMLLGGGAEELQLRLLLCPEM